MDKLTLKKAGSTFDLAYIQIQAALKYNIDRETELRLKLQKALLDENATEAARLNGLLKENEAKGIIWTTQQEDNLAAELVNRYNTANKAQLEIKEACPQWNNPQFAKLDSNYLVSNGLKHICFKLGIPSIRDQVRSWKAKF